MNALAPHPYQSLQDKLLSLAAHQLSRSPAASEWLKSAQEKAFNAFENNELPRRSTENWRYSPLSALAKVMESSASEPAVTAKPRLMPPQEADLTLVFDDKGVRLIDAPPESIRCTQIHNAGSDHEARLTRAFADLDSQHPFLQLNAAALSAGALLQVDSSEKEINIVVHYEGTQAGTLLCPRLILDLSANSRVTLSEIYQPGATVAAATAGVTQIELSAGSHLTHQVVNAESAEQVHIGHLHVWQERDSHYEHNTLALGSAFKRRDIEIELMAPGCQTRINGAYLLQEKHHCDFHTTLNHRVPHCQSEEVFRGIVGGQAKAVFNGRIHILRDAQSTVAELNNKNLLLTPSAEVNTKPELEIYADDVRCAHGATVGQLDANALFYFRSRGISQTQAYQMLSQAFIAEVMERMDDKAMAEWFETLCLPFFDEATPQ